MSYLSKITFFQFGYLVVSYDHNFMAKVWGGEGRERRRKREKTRQKEARSMKNNYREEEINKQRCSKIEKGKEEIEGKVGKLRK